jgi:hypothetical protein
VRQLHPDSAVFASLGLAPQTSPTPGAGTEPGIVLFYTALSWSRDGKQLALSFTVFRQSADPSTALFLYGLAVLDVDGSHERVLVDRQTSFQTPYVIWDLQSGATVAVPAGTVSSDAPNSSFVPAQSYSWGASGTLVPGAPFAATGATPTGSASLVGTPIGDASFGPWQSGTIVVIRTPISGQEPPNYLYLFTTAFAAWSPDGRYVADGLSVRGLLRPAGLPLPSRSVLSALPYSLENVAALPIRDAGLSEALAHDLPRPVGQPDAFDVASSPVPLAWRPDGKVLAVLTGHNGYILRATDTGRVVKSLDMLVVPPEALAPPGSVSNWDTPLWSPDGKWLLLPTLALVNTSRLGV